MDVPTRRIAIVFGAGLWRNGTATPVLRDRGPNSGQFVLRWEGRETADERR